MNKFVKDKEVYDYVLNIIKDTNMRVTKIKDLKEKGISKHLYYETLHYFNINPYDLRGGPGTKPSTLADIMKKRNYAKSSSASPSTSSMQTDSIDSNAIKSHLYRPTYEAKRHFQASLS